VRRCYHVLTTLAVTLPTITMLAQAQQAPDNRNVPIIPFDSATDFLKITPDMNFGEVLGVAVNSKGTIVVLNHPGSATAGPLYGNATTQLWEFDRTGKFVREIGKGVYGLGYAHAVRFDKYDNLWVVDKGTNAAMKFNPAGYVTLNLGRRPEGYEGHYERPSPEKAVPADGLFNGPTDVAWDPDDNIFIGDGYGNSRIAKFDKNGNWIKTWGQYGPGGEHANENPGNIRNPHNISADRQGNLYVGDRGNRRIQVFDRDGKFLRFMFMNASYDKRRQPVLGNMPANRPDETAPWALCMTNTTPQYLYTADSEPGRIYKMTLDGKILGMLGESGRGPKQFNWIHGIACPSEHELIVADMNNWRVQRLTLHPDRARATTTSSR
jgi:sugar lactone lactonase YvrE